ncbi:MAG TPA: matrixin family metalloprotease [Nitrosopumilaceae archaeon]|nr:matrixin family metalloprotease [Nitrosopumilaceae archaeon]
MNDDDKKLLGEMIKANVTKTARKNYLIMVLIIIGIAVTVGTYPIILINLGVVKLHDYNTVPSEFFINDLKVESTDQTALPLSSWFLVNGDTLRINIVNGDNYPEKNSIVRKVIYSNQIVSNDVGVIDKSTKTYYLGWQNALETAATQETIRHIPQKFQIISSERGEGDITITFSPLRNGDGKLGSTKILVDSFRNEILKAHITVYQVNEISDQTVEAVIRHELGHALGLPHVMSSRDLMNSSFSVESAYISECDINGIVTLYSEENLHPFVCKNQT